MKIKVVDIDTKEELLDVVVEQFVGSFIDGKIGRASCRERV